MTLIKTTLKTKNMLLLALISATFILSVFSYAIPPLQPQQGYGQGAFQTQDDDQSPPQLTIEETNNETDQAGATTTTTTTLDNNQEIILDDITIPINSNTTLSLEMPDSKITVEPNK